MKNIGEKEVKIRLNSSLLCVAYIFLITTRVKVCYK